MTSTQSTRAKKGKAREVSLPTTSGQPSSSIPIPKTDDYMLRCLIEGQTTTFKVTIPAEADVGELKKVIKAENTPELDRYAAHSFILFKVNIDLNAHTEDSLSRLDVKEDDKGEKLKEWELVSDYWLTQPPMNRLHIFVRLPVHGTVQENPSHFRVMKRAHNEEHRDPTPLPRMFKRRRLDFLEGSKTIYQSDMDDDQNLNLPSNADFDHLLTTPGMLAADKTMYIESLDKSTQYQYMYLRPRRWGKSTFLQTLADYYDKNKADQFEETFGQLYIGKHPTPSRSSLLVLLFDFSQVDTVNHFMKSFHGTLNRCLRTFLVENARFLGHPDPCIVIQDGNVAESMARVLNLVRAHSEMLFVGVDEYDAPANSCLFSGDEKHRNRYEGVASLFKTQFFTIMKRATGATVQKYWLTGVLPAFRDGISPLAATSVISKLPQFHGLCGLTHDEVDAIARKFLGRTHEPNGITARVKYMRNWYNGYKFCPYTDGSTKLDRLFNPQLVFTHLRALSEKVPWLSPDKDAEAIPSAVAFAAITGHSTSNDLLPLLQGDLSVDIKYEFGPDEVRFTGQNLSLTWSLLFHLGVITPSEDSALMRIPNASVRRLVIRRLLDYLSHHDRNFMQMTEHCTVFTQDSFPRFVTHLQRFFQSRPIRSIQDSKEASLQSIVELFWHESGSCVPEMCLLADPCKPKGQGRFRFVDIFMAPTARFPADREAAIELKSISLRALWKATRPNMADEPSYHHLSDFRTVIQQESEAQLLKRRYCYWNDEQGSWCIREVEKIKSDACLQLDEYMGLIENGDAERSGGLGVGILDGRVRCTHGKSHLDAYLVLSIGDTRVLGWFVSTRDASLKYEKLDT